MRLTDTEIRIMELFTNNIFLEISMNGTTKMLNKHYRVVRSNILRLLEKNLLRSKELGGAKIISLNLDEITLPKYMGYIEETKAYGRIFQRLPQIKDIITEARDISPLFCIGLFGSCADNTYKRGSDIDIFIICRANDAKKFENLIAQFPSIEDMIDWNVFSINEFQEGIEQKGMLIYTEILKNKMIICGAELFYNIISRAEKIEIRPDKHRKYRKKGL